MLHFYGVVLHISIETLHLVGYTSYFESISIISCGQGYMVILEVYGVWESKTMSLFNFIHTHSAYNPEF